jgi:hypothetical protein
MALWIESCGVWLADIRQEYRRSMYVAFVTTENDNNFNICCLRAILSRHSAQVKFFIYAFRKTCVQCPVSWSVGT